MPVRSCANGEPLLGRMKLWIETWTPSSPGGKTAELFTAASHSETAAGCLDVPQRRRAVSFVLATPGPRRSTVTGCGPFLPSLPTVPRISPPWRLDYHAASPPGAGGWARGRGSEPAGRKAPEAASAPRGISPATPRFPADPSRRSATSMIRSTTITADYSLRPSALADAPPPSSRPASRSSSGGRPDTRSPRLPNRSPRPRSAPASTQAGRARWAPPAFLPPGRCDGALARESRRAALRGPDGPGRALPARARPAPWS